MIFVPKLLDKNSSEKNNTYALHVNTRKHYPSSGVGRTYSESKGSIQYCHKRAYLIYIFQNTRQK